MLISLRIPTVVVRIYSILIHSLLRKGISAAAEGGVCPG